LEQFADKTGFALSLDNTGPEFFAQFQAYLVATRRNANGTTLRTMAFLKTFLLWCKRTKRLSDLSFEAVRIRKPKKTHHLALNEEELKRMETLDLSGNKRLEVVRDLFLLGVYTGQRFGDIASFRREMIVQESHGRVYLRRIVQKTQEPINIPLSESAWAILNKYGFELPLLTVSKANHVIKEVAQLAGLAGAMERVKFVGSERLAASIPKHRMISTHTARRTFATISATRGMPLVYIQRVLGHASVSQTLEYIKDVDQELHAKMGEIWD
jgi:integrase